MAWVGFLGDFSHDRASTDKRGKARRKLAFESVLTAPRPPAKVVVLNLSEAGLMLHAAEELTVGETFEVDLPGMGGVEARVVWKSATLYGCAFVSPVSRGTISAILLKVQPVG
jgi:hypothetical protein